MPHYKLSEEGHKSSEVTRQPSYHSLVSVTVTAQQKLVLHSIKIKAVRISPSSFNNREYLSLKKMGMPWLALT